MEVEGGLFFHAYFAAHVVIPGSAGVVVWGVQAWISFSCKSKDSSQEVKQSCPIWGINHKTMNVRVWWCEHVCSSVVLQGCEGLVDVWLLLLCTAGVHGRVLHTDDMWDAQPQERQPSDRPHRAPQTGRITILTQYYSWSIALPLGSSKMVFLCRGGRWPRPSSAWSSSLRCAGSHCTSAGF